MIIAFPILGFILVNIVKYKIDWKKLLMRTAAFSSNSVDKFNTNNENTDYEWLIDKWTLSTNLYKLTLDLFDSIDFIL